MKRLVTGLLSLVFLFPLCGLYAQDSAEDNTFRIMSYNIRNGRGMDNVLDLQRIAAVINRETPDIIALQEIDSVTGRSRQVDVMRVLANETLMYPVYAAAIPHDGGKYGVGMLSKEKPLNSYHIPLPGREEARTLLVVEFKKFRMACTHFSLNEEDRLASVALIRTEAQKSDKPFLVAGDLNAHPDSPVMAELQKDFQLISNPKTPTFPSPEPKGCIDYIAAYKNREKLPFAVVRSWVTNEPVASDHRPVMATLRFEAKKEDIFRAAPYLQNPVGGGITVMWQTYVPTHSWVEYGTDTLNLKRARTFLNGQVVFGLHNKIRLEDLQGGQKYYYRVCSQEILVYEAYRKVFGETAVSPFYSFTLPTASTQDFTAIIFNDLHKQEATLNGLHDLVKQIPYDFVVFNGDCIDDPRDEEETLHHIAMQCNKVGASGVPVFYLRGNHEIRNAYSVGLHYLLEYVGDKTYGAFNWGDTRIVMLDCGEDKPDDTWVYYDMNDFTKLREDQVDFLRKELSGTAFKKASKRVMLNHIPLYGGKKDGFHPSRDLWSKLLAKAPFDVNISAHTHRYAYYPKGEVGNNFPVVVGGSQRLDNATVMVLQKKGKEMTLRVMNGKGETVYDLKL